MKEKHLDNFVKGLKNGIPIALGYFAVAFTLGIQAKNAGITAFQSAVASFGLHASAGEYIAFTLFGANATIFVMVMMEVVANARYLLMSCALSQKIPADTPIWKRLIMGYFITDEIFGASISVAGKLDPYYNFWTCGSCLTGMVCRYGARCFDGQRIANQSCKCFKCRSLWYVYGMHNS